jgi:hypothetical protein
MLDPLTAFATAVNAIQLAELGLKVLRNAHEVPKRCEGVNERASSP